MSDLGERLSEEEVEPKVIKATKVIKITKFTKVANVIKALKTTDFHIFLQVEEMMRWADKDGDGKVILNKFCAFFYS